MSEAEAVIVDDREGEAQLDEEIVRFQTRRRRTKIGLFFVAAALLTLFAWPESACEELASETCSKGILHCGRSRAIFTSEAVDEAECQELLDRLKDRNQTRSLYIELPRRFPEAVYTEEEDQAVRRRGYRSGGSI